MTASATELSAMFRQETINCKLTWHFVEGPAEGLSEARQVAHSVAASRELQGAIIGKDREGKPVLMLCRNEVYTALETNRQDIIKDLYDFVSLYSIEMGRCGRCHQHGGGYRDTYK